MLMQRGQNDSPTYLESILTVPYASAIATTASTSSQSICSDDSSSSSSQLSDTFSVTSSASSDSESSDSFCLPATTAPCHQQVASASPQWKARTNSQHLSLKQHMVASEVTTTTTTTAHPQRRPNPRRTGSGTTTRTGCPPALVRQSDRKVNFVDSLVDSSTQIVETIWPLSSVVCRGQLGRKSVLPLRTFIQETLRRSQTSYSTLQVALYYLILIKPHVPSHDFTMEQADDMHSSRVLQCGRRMFLAALILASKYLQDRNYSARAWSKISGLNTLEINQNEIAFLIAVNWKLHITDEIFQRWTEIVLKFTPPPQPPTPGASAHRLHESKGLDWQHVIRKLNPELDNIEGLLPASAASPEAESPSKAKPEVVVSPSSRPWLPLPQTDSLDTAAIPRSHSTPLVMEPSLSPAYSAAGRLAPALGLLPTPRLTPHSSGFNTPAVSAASLLLGKTSMSLAMCQAASAGTASGLDRWPVSTNSSPQSCYLPARRSSLANSVSTASSPESMISDSSRTSCSSSVSSASSLASAPPAKLDVQARCRYAKRRYMRPTIITSVPEGYEESCLTSSPESYTGPVGKDLSDGSDSEDLAGARTLQELHYAYNRTSARLPTPSTTHSPIRAGSKRSRTDSDDSLQENVRKLLGGRDQWASIVDPTWSSTFTRSESLLSNERSQVPARSPYGASSKRLCCSAEASQGYSGISSLHPSVGGSGGPGMWAGILDVQGPDGLL